MADYQDLVTLPNFYGPTLKVLQATSPTSEFLSFQLLYRISSHLELNLTNLIFTMFFTTFLIWLFISIRGNCSTLLSINTTNAKPWTINEIYTFTPNGWPGSPPYSTFFVSITNLNTLSLRETRYGSVSFPSTTANCSTKWNGFAEEDPFDRIIVCDAGGFGEGRWTVEIQRPNTRRYGPSPTKDFTLQVKLEESMWLNEGLARLTFGAGLRFSIWTNLRYICAGSGFCKSWLDKDHGPYSVTPWAKVEFLAGDCARSEAGVRDL